MGLAFQTTTNVPLASANPPLGHNDEIRMTNDDAPLVCRVRSEFDGTLDAEGV
jgi:hypothetical protein